MIKEYWDKRGDFPFTVLSLNVTDAAVGSSPVQGSSHWQQCRG